MISESTGNGDDLSGRVLDLDMMIFGAVISETIETDGVDDLLHLNMDHANRASVMAIREIAECP